MSALRLLLWPIAQLARGLADGVLVALRLKRIVPTGRPVWRRYTWWDRLLCFFTEHNFTGERCEDCGAERVGN